MHSFGVELGQTRLDRLCVDGVPEGKFIGEYMKKHKGTPLANLKDANKSWMESEERAAVKAAKKGKIFKSDS